MASTIMMFGFIQQLDQLFRTTRDVSPEATTLSSYFYKDVANYDRDYYKALGLNPEMLSKAGNLLADTIWKFPTIQLATVKGIINTQTQQLLQGSPITSIETDRYTFRKLEVPIEKTLKYF